MSERESRIRSILLAYFPMLIAVLSLVTSIYNGYLNNKFVSIIQTNLGRGEYMRTCKEIIDAYFQVKFRVGLITASSGQGGSAAPADSATARIEAANAVNKFAALGTYLANLRDDDRRQQYTELSQGLEKIVSEAARNSSEQVAKLFEPADRLFNDMNTDCVKSAKAM
jgi:hypothetical protein